jgi:hypothetical protein
MASTHTIAPPGTTPFRFEKQFFFSGKVVGTANTFDDMETAIMNSGS